MSSRFSEEIGGGRNWGRGRIRVPVERSRELLQSLNVRNRMPIFNSGGVTAKEASAFFDVALAQVLRFAELTETVANEHGGLSSFYSI